MSKDTVEILTALLTPLLAIIATMIALFQWRLEKQKWRLSLYDKRFETYKAVTAFLSLIAREGKCHHADEIEFLQKAGRNEFLFDSDIRDYIEQLYRQSLKLNYLEREVFSNPSEAATDHRTRLANQAGELSQWFSEQFNVARSKFAPYLSITSR